MYWKDRTISPGTWFIEALGSSALVVGLSDLKDASQSKLFYSVLIIFTTTLSKQL